MGVEKVVAKHQIPNDPFHIGVGSRVYASPAKLLQTASHLYSLPEDMAQEGMNFLFPYEPNARIDWALRIWRDKSSPTPNDAERRLRLSRKIEEVLYQR